MQKTTSSFFTEMVSGLLVFLFLYTGFSKLLSVSNFAHQLHFFPYLKNISAPVAWAVPGLELLTALLLMIPALRRKGLAAALVLLSVFTGYLIFMLVFHKTHLPCSCGGVLKYMSWGQHVVFNLVCMTMTAIALILEKSQAPALLSLKGQERA